MTFEVDRSRVRRSFERAANTYDGAAVVERRMIDELIDRLQLVKLSPKRILDAGCGTGYALSGLHRRFPQAEIILLDFAVPMLRQVRAADPARVSLLCGDVEKSPIATQSVDMIFCSSVLHWCNLGPVFAEFLRLLKPGGLLTFATFGPDTLKELRAAWKSVDTGVHVHEFMDMHNIGDFLITSLFSTPVMDVDYLTVTHRDLPAVLRDLKELGASNAAAARSRGLTGKRKHLQFREVYERLRTEQGLYESTCEIVYGHAWAPEQVNPRDDNGVAVPISQLRRC